jgi:Ser/Thr protein kinase RdoA (MazF antagonist)
MIRDAAAVATQFHLPGEVVSAVPYGTGHVNDTYLVACQLDGRTVRHILQRINHEVFKNPPALMENVARVTDHVRAKLRAECAPDIERRTLTLLPTRDGATFLHDGDGLYWRMYRFIEAARTYDVIENPRQAREAAMAFGRFQRQLADLPTPRLHETIPRFHDTRARMQTLLQAIEQDPHNRAADGAEEIAFALDHEAMCGLLLDHQAKGELPERITHNDTKLNNVMIDDATSEGVCVIDLDTVMPGLALYDFGDMVRTATNTGAEDETDLSKISSDPVMFEALVQGYLAAARDMLTPLEVDLLPFAGRLMTFEVGIRFLTDFLLGDTYFKIHRQNHNLHRCRTQFQLVRSIKEHEDAMHRIIAENC